MYWFLFSLGFAALVYLIFIKWLKYWVQRGVPQANLGTVWLDNFRAIFQLAPQADIIQSFYNNLAGHRCGGAYQFMNPVFIVRDPDLIKQITVKDFDHFVDHNQFVSEEIEPLWGKNLFALKGDRWREMRATLSPSFTSSKMRMMFGLMTECAEQFVRYFEEKNSNIVNVEFKDAFTRFTNDVIASASFGITCNSLENRENEFYLMGKEATNFSGFWKGLKFLFIFFLPKLAKLLGMRMFSKRVGEFFRRLVKTNIESREKNGIVRPDMIHLLMEARKGRLKHEDNVSGVEDSGFAVIEESLVGKEEKFRKRQLTDDDLTAQALIFFFAGFDTVSTMMCFTIYELAVNPDIQEKLQNEVDETFRNSEESLTYEALLRMKYLDMVISEVLRKWPAVIATDRVCVKPCTIQPVNSKEKPITLKEGDVLSLPVYALHRDPYFYPDPDRFDPERFSDENKSHIYPYSYIPFGVGPRSCIGNRFALLEIKTVLFHILSKFDIVVVEKSNVPLKLAKNQFNPTSEGGFWFGLKLRKVAK